MVVAVMVVAVMVVTVRVVTVMVVSVLPEAHYILQCDTAGSGADWWLW